MMSKSDFSKKQVLFVFFSEGEKLAFQNENVVVKDCEGHIKMQCSCYRVFLIVAVGNFVITNVLVRNADRYGFRIACMTHSFRLYCILGSNKEGNTILHQKQYSYHDSTIASYIVKTKMLSQERALVRIRNKSDYVKEVIEGLHRYSVIASNTNDVSSLRGYEGLASKQYFKALFSNTSWNGRQPRLKADPVNTALDIGYTILFAYVEALLASFGFDLYVGFYHTQFYMRKSLVCDMVEPFRPLIDYQIRKAISLKQIKKEDFILNNHQYQLKYEKNKEYVSLFLDPIIKSREDIFSYILLFYRAFMKDSPAECYPVYLL